jgi:hypothetical protein
MDDFMLKYFIPIYDNFNIQISSIKAILQQAQKKTRKNKVLNAIDDKLGKNTKEYIPFIVNLLHWLIYLPIYIVYFVFEVFKVILTDLHRFVLPIFIVTLIILNVFVPQIFDIDNLLAVKSIFNKQEWIIVVDKFIEGSRYEIGESIYVQNGIMLFFSSCIFIVTLLMVYIAPPFIISEFVNLLSLDLAKTVDWIGGERTFEHIFLTAKQKTVSQYQENKNRFYTKSIESIVVNLACIIVIWLIGMILYHH